MGLFLLVWLQILEIKRRIPHFNLKLRIEKYQNINFVIIEEHVLIYFRHFRYLFCLNQHHSETECLSFFICSKTLEIFCLFLGSGSTLRCLESISTLCSGITLGWFDKPYWVLEIEFQLIACKKITLHTLLPFHFY